MPLSDFLTSRSSRGMRLIAGLEKADLAREKEEHKQLMELFKIREDKSKFVVGKLMDLYSTTKSLAMKNHVADSMRSFYNALDPLMKRAVDPYIKHSPISPEQERLRRFTEMNPRPKSPGQEIQTTKGAGGEISMTNLDEQGQQLTGDPRQYAEDYFRLSDWERQKDQVVFGHAQDSENFLSFGDGNAAVRNKEGRISLLSAFDNYVKDKGLDPNVVNADGGYDFQSGTPIKVNQGGETLTIIRGPNVADPKAPWGMRVIDRIAAPKGITMWKIPNRAKNIAMKYVSKDAKDLFTKEITQEIENAPIDSKGKKDFSIALKKLAIAEPEVNWNIVPVREIPYELLGFIPAPGTLGDKTEYALVPLPKQTARFTDANNASKLFYVGDEGAIVNSTGQVIASSAEEFERRFAQHKSETPKPDPELIPPPRKAKIPTQIKPAVEKTLQGTINLFAAITAGSPSMEQREEAQKALITFSKSVGLGPENWREAGKLAKQMGGFVWEWYLGMVDAAYGGATTSMKNFFSFEKE